MCTGRYPHVCRHWTAHGEGGLVHLPALAYARAAITLRELPAVRTGGYSYRIYYSSLPASREVVGRGYIDEKHLPLGEKLRAALARNFTWPSQGFLWQWFP